MSKRVDARRPSARTSLLCVTCLVGAALIAASQPTWGGIPARPASPTAPGQPPTDPGTARPSTNSRASAERSAGGYVIRCWQFGTLLFEETGVQLTGEAAPDFTRIRALDRQRAPLWVAEAGSATCLIKSLRGDGERTRDR
jgi:hypothetical protein